MKLLIILTLFLGSINLAESPSLSSNGDVEVPGYSDIGSWKTASDFLLHVPFVEVYALNMAEGLEWITELLYQFLEAETDSFVETLETIRVSDQKEKYRCILLTVVSPLTDDIDLEKIYKQTLAVPGNSVSKQDVLKALEIAMGVSSTVSIEIILA